MDGFGVFSQFLSNKIYQLKSENQQKRWMDGILFEEWIRELDGKLASEARNVALVIDN